MTEPDRADKISRSRSCRSPKRIVASSRTSRSRSSGSRNSPNRPRTAASRGRLRFRHFPSFPPFSGTIERTFCTCAPRCDPQRAGEARNMLLSRDPHGKKFVGAHLKHHHVARLTVRRLANGDGAARQKQLRLEPGSRSRSRRRLRSCGNAGRRARSWGARPRSSAVAITGGSARSNRPCFSCQRISKLTSNNLSPAERAAASLFCKRRSKARPVLSSGCHPS